MEEDRRRRLAAFRAALRQRNLDGAVVSWPPHAFYLAGLPPASALPLFLLIDARRAIAVLPESLAGADAANGGTTVVTYVDASLETLVSAAANAHAALAAAIARIGFAGKRVGVEPEHLRAVDLAALAAVGETVEIGTILGELRRRKDASEVRRIRANLAALAAGFEAAREAIRPGATELAVWSAIHRAMMERVGAPFPLDGNLASGPRTLLPEPQATGRVLEDGDLVLVDLYPIIDGYCGDLTRTFVVGTPNPAQRDQHAILERALRRGVAALRPGILARDVDAAVRAEIAAEGCAPYFPHHSGHGLGLQAQEPPFLIPADDTPLVAGDVVAIEPGLYHPAVGGMRLEGNYLVTDTGGEPLTDYPFELIACA